MRRFFVPADSLRGREVALSAETARRLARVLRLRPGDHILLADGGPLDREVELTAVSSRGATGVVVGERPAPAEPAVEIVLYQSLIRAARFELVLEKGTEIGVSRFVPVVAARTQIQPREERGRAERWRRIVVEAAEQCGRGRLPVIDSPLPLAEALRSAGGLLVVPWEEERRQGLAAYLRGLKERPSLVSLFIGPEGGYEAEEAEAARAAGATLVSLGSRVMRAETAGIVAAALVLSELGEMGG